MNYAEFCDRAAGAVKDTLGKGYEVALCDVTKNNDLKLKGMTVKRAGARVSPTIYMEQYYDMYTGGMSFDEAVREMIGCYEHHSETGIDAGFFSDFEAVKEHIVYKIVNMEMNEKLLGEVPYVKWNDLAIVFCCLVSDTQDGCATILIRNEHVDMWGTSVDVIYDIAKENTPNLLPDEMEPMAGLLFGMLKRNGALPEDVTCPDDMYEGMPEMYVLTNRSRIFGASSILYSEHIREMSDRFGKGLYILPSSIHEVIILPEDDDCDTDYMRDMIREINETQVDVEDRLSNSLYYYDRDLGDIRIAV